jgi:hypothetical protein
MAVAAGRSRSVSGAEPHGDGRPVLPDTTVDEKAPGWGDEVDDSNDQRLLDERPPHWE